MIFSLFLQVSHFFRGGHLYDPHCVTIFGLPQFLQTRAIRTHHTP